MNDSSLVPEIEIDIMVEAAGWSSSVPTANDIVSEAAEAALRDVAVREKANAPIELSILLTDNAAIAELNLQWRGKTGPTNVLSFPAENDGVIPGAPVLLGDVAIALETLIAEAHEAGIEPRDHLRHLVVHGVLHLCGYDHENDVDADRMESREIVILEVLGVSDPYAAAERRIEEARP